MRFLGKHNGQAMQNHNVCDAENEDFGYFIKFSVNRVVNCQLFGTL